MPTSAKRAGTMLPSFAMPFSRVHLTSHTSHVRLLPHLWNSERVIYVTQSSVFAPCQLCSNLAVDSNQMLQYMINAHASAVHVVSVAVVVAGSTADKSHCTRCLRTGAVHFHDADASTIVRRAHSPSHNRSVRSALHTEACKPPYNIFRLACLACATISVKGS